jgi:two-component system nitrate/nitrite response regulator NarL
MKNFPPERNIRILLADDHPTVLLGIKSFLSTQNHIEVVGEALSGTEVLNLARQLLPDIIVMDISMPGLNGIEATSILRKELPDVKIVILTMHDDREYVLQFLQSGASAYVLKISSPTELVSAIDAVWKGGAYFSPQIAELLRKEHQNGFQPRNEPALTEREEQVLFFIAKGRSSKEIADLLFISERTVNKHRENLMEKLKIHTIAELTHYAISKKYLK